MHPCKTTAAVPGGHPWLGEAQAEVVRVQAALQATTTLDARGLVPDLVIAKSGWGEAMCVKDLWPRYRLLCLMDFFDAAEGSDFGFDPEFGPPSLDDKDRQWPKNFALLEALLGMDAGVAHTGRQHRRLQAPLQSKVKVRGQIDPSRLRFVDRLACEECLRVLQVSAVHRHLTCPVMLAWSCIEALSAPCHGVGGRTGPVTEFIKHDDNSGRGGFFDVAALADTLAAAVDRRHGLQPLRRRACDTAFSRGDFRRIALLQYQALIERVTDLPVADGHGRDGRIP